MRFAIVGAGGVGGYFGGRLADAGVEVHFLARGGHLEALRARGLHVKSIDGDFQVAVRATDDATAVGPVDVIIVAVKSWQLAGALPAIRAMTGPETVVLPLLNGVEAADSLAHEVEGAHVLTGFCRIIAEIEEPGVIRHHAAAPTIGLGERDNTRSERVLSLARVLTDAGVRADVPEDIDAAVWEKFMLIATWSGIGAVTRAPVGAWRAVPALRDTAGACLHEVVSVARARGVALGDERVAETLARIDRVDAESTTSMQRDIVAGRPSELEAQNGAVVRLGAEASIPTPAHSFIYHALLPQEQSARR